MFVVGSRGLGWAVILSRADRFVRHASRGGTPFVNIATFFLPQMARLISSFVTHGRFDVFFFVTVDQI